MAKKEAPNNFAGQGNPADPKRKPLANGRATFLRRPLGATARRP